MNELTIGQLIKSKREAKNLNIKVISQQTKIHIGLLEHLENDNLSALPSKAYVKGFVKSTAKILAIKESDALDALEKTYQSLNIPSEPLISKSLSGDVSNFKIDNNSPSMKHAHEQNKSDTNPRYQIPYNFQTTKNQTLKLFKDLLIQYSPLLTKFAFFVILLVFGFYGLKNFVDKKEESHALPKVLSASYLKKSKLQANKQSPVGVGSVEAMNAASSRSLSATTPAPTAQPAPIAPAINVNIINEQNEAKKTSETKAHDMGMKNISLGEKQFSIDTSVNKEQLEIIFPLKFRLPNKKGIQNLYLNAVDGDSWVTYKVDDREIKKYVLRQGRSVFMHGEKIRLFVGNPNTLKIFYNNQLIKMAKTSRNIVFPETEKTNFLTPLFVFDKDGSVFTSDEYLKLHPNSPLPEATTPKYKKELSSKAIKKIETH